MSDRIDTNGDLVATLAQIGESLNSSALPTLEAVEAQLIPLLDDAEARQDAQAITLIQGTYARAQELIIVAQQNREAAVTAMEIAQQVRKQRDAIAQEYDTLHDAVINDDRDHPLVSDLAETISEEIYEYQEMYGEDSYYEGKSDGLSEFTWALANKIGLTQRQCSRLVEHIRDGGAINAEQKDLLRRAFDSFVPPISDKFGPDPDDDWDDDEDGGDDE